MKLPLVRIGNSRGVRLPRAVLRQAGLDQAVDLVVRRDGVLLRPHRAPREGWEAAYARARRDPLDRAALGAPSRPEIVSRFDVHLARLGPRPCPCVVLSPDERNRCADTVTVAPMLTSAPRLPAHVPIRIGGRTGAFAVDQIQTVDRSRLLRRLGRLDPAAAERILAVLAKLFAP
jgi:mRNA interferase MazF